MMTSKLELKHNTSSHRSGSRSGSDNNISCSREKHNSSLSRGKQDDVLCNQLASAANSGLCGIVRVSIEKAVHFDNTVAFNENMSIGIRQGDNIRLLSSSGKLSVAENRTHACPEISGGYNP